MRRAVKLASRYGIGAVGVANSNHFGAAGHYAKIAAARDQIGLAFSNSDSLVRPQDGTEAINGTNPIAMAAPSADGRDFVLDMATSETAFSKLLSTGVSLSSVVPLAPLGGFKGQGLGTMVQILCAVLSEMPFDCELSHLYDPPFDIPRKISHFFLSIDLKGFGQPMEIKARIARLLQKFRSSTPAKVDPVRVPGDVERLAREERLRDGIPVAADVYDLLKPYSEARHALAI
jgi:LDH2 family malate/lactate/ureidoglycolate dehydrogenase